MKRVIFILIAMLSLVASVLYAEITVTTTPQVVLAPTKFGACYFVSIKNTGSETLYFRKNTTTNMYLAADFIEVASGDSYSSPVAGTGKTSGAKVTKIVIATESSTTTATVSFE